MKKILGYFALLLLSAVLFEITRDMHGDKEAIIGWTFIIYVLGSIYIAGNLIVGKNE